jgi:hypothetical protein
VPLAAPLLDEREVSRRPYAKLLAEAEALVRRRTGSRRGLGPSGACVLCAAVASGRFVRRESPSGKEIRGFAYAAGYSADRSASFAAIPFRGAPNREAVAEKNCEVNSR